MRTICQVCCEPAPIYRNGRIGKHKDGIGKECWMVGRRALPWDEPGVREAVSGRSGGICEYCQQRRATEKHHRVSRGVGGGWTPANILDLCHVCHREATEHPLWARTVGLIVKSTASPGTVPVVREDGTTFQPTDEVTR